MRRYLLCAGVLTCMAAGVCWAADEGATKKAAPKPVPQGDGELVVGQPIRYANLAIFPLSSRTPKSEDRFITLDKGLKAGTVTIMEIGAEGSAETAGTSVANAAPPDRQTAQPRGRDTATPLQQPTANQQAANQASADVNHLVLINRSAKPLYLMPGEIVVGGQQDRTIAQEYVIPPGPKPVTIEVFCVEHGRWVGRGTVENASVVAGAISNSAAAQSSAFVQGAGGAPGQAAGAAGQSQEGKFIGSVGNVNKAARIAVQHDKEQGKVWDKVAEVNAKNGVQAASGDFAGNYVEEKAVLRLEPYIKALHQKVADSTNVVGVAVAIDGKMDTLDVFESTPLFRQLWPKLLKSYALDAVNAAEDSGQKAEDKKSANKFERICGVEDARKFLAEAISARPENSTTNGDVTVTTLSTDHILTFCAQDSQRSSGAAGGAPGGMGGGIGGGGFGGGFGGGIHGFGGAK